MPPISPSLTASKKPILIGCIIGIICLAIITLLFLVTKTNLMSSTPSCKLPSFATEFFTPTLTPDTQTTAYTTHGIEKCQSLDDQRQGPGTRAFVDTLRIQKWKPIEAPQNQDPNIEYCAFYTDADASRIILEQQNPEQAKLAPIKDPIAATHTTCSPSALGVEASPLVLDAFPDKSPTLTLNSQLAYDKCVLKLDKTKANPQNVQDFFSKLTQNDPSPGCSGLLQTLQSEQDKYKERIAQLARDIAQTRSQITSLEAQEVAFRQSQNIPPTTSYTDIQRQLQSCAQDTNDLTTSFNNASSAYKASHDNMTAYTTQQQAALNSIRAAQQTTTQDIRTLLSRIQSLQDVKATLESQVISLSQQLQQLAANNEACQRTLAAETARANTLQTDLAQRLAQLETLALNLQRAQAQEQELRANIAKRQAEVADIETKLADVTRKLQECAQNLPFIRTQAEQWRQRYETAKRAYDACVVAKAPITAQVEAQETRTKALYAEIDDIKKRCRVTESTYYNTDIQTTRILAERTLETVQEQCKAVSNMREKKTQLVQEIAQIQEQQIQAQRSKQQAPDCQRVRQVCCPPVKHFGWNDDGRRSDTAITTSGRIDRIRDSGAVGNNNMHARFVINNSTTSAPFKILDAKRDKGSKTNNWIKTSRNLSGDPVWFSDIIVYNAPLYTPS